MKNHLLRLCLVLIIYQASITNAKAQWVSIADTAFGDWLNTHNFSQCLQGSHAAGWHMDTTCNKVMRDTILICQNSYLKSIDEVHYFDSLRHLYCNGNLLANLPTLPNRLSTLYCPENQLVSLPQLPNSLRKLDCNNNQLTTIPILPNELDWIMCHHNQIAQLPALPDSLRHFDCSHNLLTILPSLPKILSSVDCSFNLLTAVTDLPESIWTFYCNNNPNLYCLPHLLNIDDLNFSVTGIICLPNYPNFDMWFCDPPLNSVPLCGLFNPNGCQMYSYISGKFYWDANSNCVYNSGEVTTNNIRLLLYKNDVLEQQTSTHFSGDYSFVTNDSLIYKYYVDTANLPFFVACPDSGYHTSNITALDSFDVDMNFGLNCKPGFDLVSHSIMGVIFIPAQQTKVFVSAGDYTNFFGGHCASGVSGSVQLIIDGSATYVAPAIGALAPSTISNDTLTWNIADFGMVNFFSTFNIMVQTDSNALLGQQVCFTLVTNPILGDKNSTNNMLTNCFVIGASYDPNKKEVYPAGNIDTAQKWLTYTIHFQNTGTAEAQHIYVTDTLDTNVDPASFQLLAYSHQPMVQIKENAVRFNFPNINLPDSNTNEPLSHGYVQYKVKLKNNLPLGTQINNTAFIYFDFNAAVVTNTTSNTITNIISHLSPSLSEGEGVMQIQIYPNPASELVIISANEKLIGCKLSITDVLGRAVSPLSFCFIPLAGGEGSGERLAVQTSRFANGIYFVTVENEKGRVTKKLVIENP